MEDIQLSTVMNTVTETHDQVMKLTVTVNSLIARLEAFEKMYASNNVAPKRAIKVAPVSNPDVDETASVSSAGSKRKAVSSTTVTTGSGEKVVNALTFFKKYIIFKNYNDLKSKYSTPAMIEEAKIGVKKAEGTEAYWIAVGNSIWKMLDKEQKKEVREEFSNWKKIHQVGCDMSQLNEDEAEDDS